MMMQGILLIAHAISMTLALAIFMSIYRKNRTRGRWFLIALLIWGSISLYNFFGYSVYMGLIACLLYTAFYLITFRSLKYNSKDA
ncbi:hypothetical protein LCM10_01840 [Rossellomorea aquimaris]|uniref:hypothetical protein n=1 Tax=Rossellomorea aquimaris TaxID=189382 RepID=UPI001CD3D33C|nr:hypothetical protein [Rossellomorea aquimaris]MCA1053712.1 hypothetical protein [Rossellomorea aquimaris]